MDASPIGIKLPTRSVPSTTGFLSTTNPFAWRVITMTAALDPTTRHDVLVERLTTLRRERAHALAEIAPQGVGDDADRATNVDAHVRLALLDERIATVELELVKGVERNQRSAGDAVGVGDVVTVDFGDGPEEYLLGSVEQAGEGVDVITPGSPLGRALVGAAPGSTVEYRTATGRNLSAQVVGAA
jgi:transcription elongation factor GreA